MMVTTGADLPDFTDVFARPDWHERAACRGVDVNAFFSGLGESTRTAKAVCGTCPVAEPCREYAVGYVDVRGVWGGTSR